MSRIWYGQASFTLVNRKTLKREVPSFHRFPEPQSLLGSRIYSASLTDRNVDNGPSRRRLCPGGGGGYSIYPWVGRCGSALHTLTLFETKIADFPTLFKTEFRFLIPSLRHSSNISAGCLSSKNRVMGSCLRKDTLFKTKIDKIDTLFKTKIPKNLPRLAARPH